MDGALQRAWVFKNIGWKVLSLIIVSVVMVFEVWDSPLPSFLDYSQLSASQIQSFLYWNHITEPAPAITPTNVPTIHTDSPGVDIPEPQPNKRPVETIEPDPSSEPHGNTTTVSESTPNPIHATSNASTEDDTQLVPGNTRAEAPTNSTSDVFVEEDTQLVPRITTAEAPTNTTSDVFVEDDTQLVPGITTAEAPTTATSGVFVEDDTQLVPGNTTAVSDSPNPGPNNATSDVFVEEDTQLVPGITTAEAPTNATSDVFVEEDTQLVPGITAAEAPTNATSVVFVEEDTQLVPGITAAEAPTNATSVVFVEDDTQLLPGITTAEAPTTATSGVFVEDTQLVPGNTTAVSDGPNPGPNNATSDVFVEDDTQLVDPSTLTDDPQQFAAEENKYIVPMLSGQVGTGNQLMEYKSAAVIARTLNRTLCLVPFFFGPSRHFGYLGDRHSGLVMEDRYDIDTLSKFVKVAHMDECMQECHRKIDVRWQLRGMSHPPKLHQWFNDTPKSTVQFVKEYQNWGSTADVEKAMGPRNDAHCVVLGGLFPGLRWRGVSFATSAYMQHSDKVKKAADLLQARALPGASDNNFIAVHWRFEESNCRGHPLGLCFSRRSDGAVGANGRKSETWTNMTREVLPIKGKFKAGLNGVVLTKEDVSGAIYDRVLQWGVENVYLASDGWLRGKESAGILEWVVQDIRSKGINVVGLWMLAGLPNFADGHYVRKSNMAELFGLDRKQRVSNPVIALVEQELCVRAAVFVGSGQSTWSLAVADTRRGLRYKQEFTKVISGLNLGTSPEVMEQAIIDKILAIQFVAAPTGIGGGFNFTMQKPEDEIPDGWLDYDSCESRLLQGVGHCTRISS